MHLIEDLLLIAILDAWRRSPPMCVNEPLPKAALWLTWSREARPARERVFGSLAHMRAFLLRAP